VRTVPSLDPKTKVATFHLAPGYNKYHAFCAEAGITDNKVEHPMSFDANVVRNDKEDNDLAQERNKIPLPTGPQQFDLDLNMTPNTDEPVIIEDDEEDQQQFEHDSKH
jgi:hypothetical protein